MGYFRVTTQLVGQNAFRTNIFQVLTDYNAAWCTLSRSSAYVPNIGLDSQFTDDVPLLTSIDDCNNQEFISPSMYKLTSY